MICCLMKHGWLELCASAPLREIINTMPREPKKKYSMFGNMKPSDFKALGIGIELSAVIGGFAYGGYWLDERWGTTPWLLIVGVLLGTFGGGWHAMKMANGGKTPDFGFKPKKSKPTDQDKSDDGGNPTP